jgi:hypothetical protein
MNKRKMKNEETLRAKQKRELVKNSFEPPLAEALRDAAAIRGDALRSARL